MLGNKCQQRGIRQPVLDGECHQEVSHRQFKAESVRKLVLSQHQQSQSTDTGKQMSSNGYETTDARHQSSPFLSVYRKNPAKIRGVRQQMPCQIRKQPSDNKKCQASNRNKHSTARQQVSVIQKTGTVDSKLLADVMWQWTTKYTEIQVRCIFVWSYSSVSTCGLWSAEEQYGYVRIQNKCSARSHQTSAVFVSLISWLSFSFPFFQSCYISPSLLHFKFPFRVSFLMWTKREWR